jgi:hypothetical protein
MPRLVDRAKEEVRQVLVTALFFSIGFCIIIIHNRLLTAGSGIEIQHFARALVGGLIVAKVLISVDLLPFVHAFPDKPLVHNIAWKTSLYVAASVVVLYIDPFLRGLFKGLGLAASHSRAWNELVLPRTWATVIWLAVLLAVFVTLQEQSRVLGKEQLKRMFFGPKGKPSAETRFRDVA